jgi:hypothetical protein
MNNNLVPSIIIAASILVCGFLLKHEIDQKSLSSEDFLSGLESLSAEKDKDGNSRIKKSITNLVGDVGSGVREGFQKGFSSNNEGIIVGLNDIEISQVKFADGRMSNEEKVIGIIKNKGTDHISDIELNVVIKDKDGKLIDVVSSFTRVDGVLLPNSELGFSIDRSLGSFDDDKEKMQGNKGAMAEVRVVKMKAHKK